MARVMVAYGPATKNPRDGNAADAQQRQALSWASDHKSEVLEWFREGKSTMAKPIEERTRLHQALFCVRADFADDLWVPEWPQVWAEWDKALVCAVLGARRGRLIIDGSVVEPDAPSFQRATGWINLLERLDPRQSEHTKSGDMADIGAQWGPVEAARLARKLKDDFRLSDVAIARWLERFEYSSQRGVAYSAPGVNNLLKQDPWGLDVEQTALHEAAQPSVSNLPKMVVATFGADADSLLTPAWAWNDARTEPARYVLPISSGEGPASPTSAPMSERSDLMMLLKLLPIVSAVYVANEADLAADARDLSFLLALLDHHGVVVIAGGTRAAGWSQRGAEFAADFVQARSTIVLHALLRAHDQGTVNDPALSQASAYERAVKVRDQALERTLQRIAFELNEEGVPTLRGDGQWWAASVQKLLERGPR